MLKRGLIFAGVIGAALATLTAMGRSRRDRLDEHAHKEDLSRWEDEGGNLAPGRVDRPQSDAPNPG
jgi:hypothetical protein